MSVIELLTKRQRAVYDFVRDKIRNRGYGPTVREIGHHFGINSPNGVMCHLKALEKKGMISREPNMSRAIQLVADVEDDKGLPLAGQIAAAFLAHILLVHRYRQLRYRGGVLKFARRVGVGLFAPVPTAWVRIAS